MRAFGGGREQQRDRLETGTRLALLVELLVPSEQRQQIDDVIGGVIVGRDALLGHGVGDGVLEEFLQTCDSVYPVRRCAQKRLLQPRRCAAAHDGRACRLLSSIDARRTESANGFTFLRTATLALPKLRACAHSDRESVHTSAGGAMPQRRSASSVHRAARTRRLPSARYANAGVSSRSTADRAAFPAT